MVMYCGQYPQEQVQVKCLAQGHSGGGFRPLDLMTNAQPTAPHRPSSHLEVIKALYKYTLISYMHCGQYFLAMSAPSCGIFQNISRKDRTSLAELLLYLSKSRNDHGLKIIGLPS